MFYEYGSDFHDEGGKPITPGQMDWIRSLACERCVDEDDLARTMFRKKLPELNYEQASYLIDHLKSLKTIKDWMNDESLDVI